MKQHYVLSTNPFFFNLNFTIFIFSFVYMFIIKTKCTYKSYLMPNVAPSSKKWLQEQKWGFEMKEVAPGNKMLLQNQGVGTRSQNIAPRPMKWSPHVASRSRKYLKELKCGSWSKDVGPWAYKYMCSLRSQKLNLS